MTQENLPSPDPEFSRVSEAPFTPHRSPDEDMGIWGGGGGEWWCGGCYSAAAAARATQRVTELGLPHQCVSSQDL